MEDIICCIESVAIMPRLFDLLTIIATGFWSSPYKIPMGKMRDTSDDKEYPAKVSQDNGPKTRSIYFRISFNVRVLAFGIILQNRVIYGRRFIAEAFPKKHD